MSANARAYAAAVCAAVIFAAVLSLLFAFAAFGAYAENQNDAFVIYDNSTAIKTGTSSALRGAAWHPSGDFALIVGDNGTILSYDGTSITKLSSGAAYSNFAFHDIAWSPDGEYAIIVGEKRAKTYLGAILVYDNTTGAIIDVSSEDVTNGTSSMLRGIAWSPDGRAMIVGDSGSVLTFDETNGVKNMSFDSGTGNSIYGIAWNRRGTFAVAVGYSGSVLRYYYRSFSDIDYNMISGAGTSWLRSISWRPNDDYAIIAGSRGTILRYNGNEYQTKNGVDLTKYADVAWRNTDLLGAAWRPDGDFALIVGANGAVLRYVSEDNIDMLSTELSRDLHSVAWKPAANASINATYAGYALIAGDGGLLLKYPNNRPVARITVSSVVAEVANPINFYGIESYDDDGYIEKYLFDFGDNTDSGWTAASSARHTYERAGRYEASLIVSDNEGAHPALSSKIKIIVGELSPDNAPPTVDAGYDISAGINATVLFYGTAADGDGSIIYYQWDFDGDGTYDWNSTTTGNTAYRYQKSGTYKAVFRVIDDTGKEGKDTVIISVGQSKPFFVGAFDVFTVLMAAVACLALAWRRAP